jgi:hypothetical protein
MESITLCTRELFLKYSSMFVSMLLVQDQTFTPKEVPFNPSAGMLPQANRNVVTEEEVPAYFIIL